MALKQTLILILIFSHIIFATCKDANPEAKEAKGAKEAKPADKSSKPSESPDIKGNKSKQNGGKKDDEKQKGGKKDDEKQKGGKKDDEKQKGGKKDDVANVVAKQMQGVQKKIEEFNVSLKKRLDNPASSPGSRECVSECDEVFGAAIDDIKKTLDSLDSQNLMKANFDVSAVSTNVDTCNDCFEEMVGGDPEVKKLGDWVRKITGDALEALQKATN